MVSPSLWFVFTAQAAEMVRLRPPARAGLWWAALRARVGGVRVVDAASGGEAGSAGRGDGRGAPVFGVLGPLLVTRGGTAMKIASPRLRVLLAALLLRAGRAVTLHELADAIWGEAQPVGPRRAVQLYATRLRALLAQCGAGAALVTCADGYRLEVAPHRVDVLRVEVCVREADRAARHGDWESELAALTEALELWRGEPLVDVPSEVLRAGAVPRLAELRLTVRERRFDILLRQGNGAGLVDELVVLTGQHPLRERLWGQLMQALHAAGRRAEALDVYHRLRERLADELGVEPGEEIRGLHAGILRSQADSPVPRELPHDIATFAGRAADLSTLDELWAHGTALVAITGTAGVGKTTLAAHWARRNADRFPDGQLWVNLRGYHTAQALSPRQALARFLRALGIRGQDIPADVDEATAAYRSLMDGRRMLIVLDNAGSAETVRPLLPGSPGCLVIVTSRHELAGLAATEGAHLLPLGVLSETDAQQMLVRRLGATRLEAEPQAGARLIAHCARLPLALAIVAARAAARPHFPLGAIADGLSHAKGLEMFTAGADLRTVFSWSYRSLDPGAARLFRMLGLHPGTDMEERAVASLAGLSVASVQAQLATLCEASLLSEPVPGRYALHDLLRAYAAELAENLDTPSELDAARARIVDHYLHTGYTAAIRLNTARTLIDLGAPATGCTPVPLPDERAALAWFDAEHSCTLAVQRMAVELGWHRKVWELALTLGDFHFRRGLLDHELESCRHGLAAALRLGDPVALHLSHRYLGQIYLRSGRHAEALEQLGRALAIAEELDDADAQARTQQVLAWAWGQHGDFEKALHHATVALRHFESIGNRQWIAQGLNMAGWYAARLGRFEQARDRCRAALDLVTELDEKFGVASTLDSLGYIAHETGDYAEAIRCYRRSATLNHEMGDNYSEAETLERLGRSYAALGRQGDARDAWLRALLIYRSQRRAEDARRVERELAAVPEQGEGTQ